MICQKCKITIPDDSKFCKECGIRIVTPRPVEEQLEISLSGLKTIQGNKNDVLKELPVGNSKNPDDSAKYKILFKVVSGNLAGRKYSAEESLAINIGRGDNCELCIPKEMDPGISRQHCRLEITPPTVIISDLGSRNGTYLNEKLVVLDTKIDVKDGDSIKIGETVFVMEIIEFKKPSANNVVTKFLERRNR